MKAKFAKFISDQFSSDMLRLIDELARGAFEKYKVGRRAVLMPRPDLSDSAVWLFRYVTFDILCAICGYLDDRDIYTFAATCRDVRAAVYYTLGQWVLNNVSGEFFAPGPERGQIRFVDEGRDEQKISYGSASYSSVCSALIGYDHLRQVGPCSAGAFKWENSQIVYWLEGAVLEMEAGESTNKVEFCDHCWRVFKVVYNAGNNMDILLINWADCKECSCDPYNYAELQFGDFRRNIDCIASVEMILDAVDLFDPVRVLLRGQMMSVVG